MVFGAATLILMFIIWLSLIAASISRITAVFWIIICLLIVVVFAAIILVNGYGIRCRRKILEGYLIMPDVSNNIRELAVDGIKVLPIYIEGFLIGMIIMAPYVIITSLSGNKGFSTLNCLLYILSMIVSMAFGVITSLQMVVYADTGSVLKGANPLIPLKLSLRDPHSFVSALIVSLVVQIIFLVPIVIMIILICTSILAPFLFLPMLAAGSYVMARYYMRMSGKSAPVMGDSMG